MNSLNIVSRLTTTPPPSPPRSRTSSGSNADLSNGQREGQDGDAKDNLDLRSVSEKLGSGDAKQEGAPEPATDEKTPLLEGQAAHQQAPLEKGSIWRIPKRIANAILYGATVVYSTVTAPARYVIACFYDEEGSFSAILPIQRFRSLLSRRKRKSKALAVEAHAESAGSVVDEKDRLRPQQRSSSRRSPSVDSNASTVSAASSDGETGDENHEDSPARHTRSKTAAASAKQGDEIAPHRRSGRVKLLPNDEALRKRKFARAAQRKAGVDPDDVASMASTLKSPSSPTSISAKLTKYPRAPATPRPLVPRRQPSYVFSYSPGAPKKTLIIDLDETLIHSMAKGGRMSTGHMVEVRLTSSFGPGSSPAHGPGIPILYYVHERPACHEFLRKVAKWYNLIVFTASVQEYADPVIDWLERERKYFSGRYYRQHCTLRNGAYIKDLAQVEPDLSRVMILDNSPMSYIFHEGRLSDLPPWDEELTDMRARQCDSDRRLDQRPDG